MTQWCEFRLWYAAIPRPDDLFAFKREHLVPVLEKHGIKYFLLLDEPEFLLSRVEADDELAKGIESSLNESIRFGSLFSKVTVARWTPEKDARERILAARERAHVPINVSEGGWMVKGKSPDGRWVMVGEDLDKQVRAFSLFMSRVVGKFTENYLKEMPYRVEDRWLTSVFLHLILDSISVWQKEEDESREFPYL
jgi:hypothetical protein